MSATKTTTKDPQAYWKRIKVPPELLAAGWELVKRDSTAPFAMVNEKLDQDTGGFPDPQEAISAAQNCMVEIEEAAAIASEGALTNGERPTVLPLNLVDEGWRLHNRGRSGYRAERGDLFTVLFNDPADAVAEAIKIEGTRQAVIEQQEREGDVGPEFSAALVGDDEPATNGHQGDTATPAAIMLDVERIRTDGGTQQRSLFDAAVVEEYREIMAADIEQTGADQFPPLEVFFDGVDYWLADGFYRLEARRKLGQATLAAHVRQGTQRDAILFSLGANAGHGLRRTPDDKRRAVLVMLRDPEWAIWSDAVIAERVRVSVPLVRKLRHQEEEAQTWAEQVGVSATPPAPTKRRGRDGRVQDTARIGKRDKQPDRQLALDAAGHPKKNKNAPNAASSRIEHCSDCNKEITASDFQNELGQCWDCAKMGEKKPRSKNEEAKQATVATLAELGLRRRMVIALHYFKDRPGRAVVEVFNSGKSIGQHELAAAEVILPPSIVALIAADLIAHDAGKRPRLKPVGFLPRTKKTARQATKAAAPPARKTATKATVKTTGKKITKTITTKAAAGRGQRLPEKLASKAPRRPTKRAPAPAKRAAPRKPRKARSR